MNGISLYATSSTPGRLKPSLATYRCYVTLSRLNDTMLYAKNTRRLKSSQATNRCFMTLNRTSQRHQEQKRSSNRDYHSTEEESETSLRNTSNQRYSHQKGTHKDILYTTKACSSPSSLISHTVSGILSSMTTKRVAGYPTNSLKKTTTLISQTLKSLTAASGDPLTTKKTAPMKSKMTPKVKLNQRA